MNLIAEVNAANVNARLRREREAYEAGIAALKGPAEIVCFDYNGVPAQKIEGSEFVAISTNGRKNGKEWAILRNGAALHVDNVVCYLKRNEVAPWLNRTA